MTTRATRWFSVALAAGVLYLLIGRFFPQPADNLRAWRLGAYAASAVVFAMHLAYEQVRLRNAPRTMALHVAAAVAMGGAALAIAGMLNSLSATGSVRPMWFVALVAWPALTGIPAFLVALAIGIVLTRGVARTDAR